MDHIKGVERPRRRRQRAAGAWLIASAVAGLVALGLAGPAHALTEVTVNSNLDTEDDDLGDGVCEDSSGNCTLRAAAQQLSSLDDEPEDQDRINLPAGTYQLTNPLETSLIWGHPCCDDAVEIVGAGAGATVIEQTLAASVVTAVDPLSLRGLTITGGDTAASGGGINASAALTLDRVAVTGNHADGDGGGLNSNATTTIRDSVVGPANTAANGGGGIRGSLAPMTIERSVIRNNMVTVALSGGAGVSFSGAGTSSDLTIEQSTVSDNTGADFGGGIWFRSDEPAGELFLRRSTVSGNQADDEGGGVFVGEGELVGQNSTISGNTVTSGGTSQGGGVQLRAATGTEQPAASLFNLTVANNSADDGPALRNASQGAFQLFGSIISGSCATFGLGSFSSNGYNVATDGTCNLVGTADRPNTNPALGGLGSNGGLTQTHAIGPGSPALDLIPPTVPPCGAAVFNGHIDQRDAARPFGSACDAGAFEFTDSDGDGIDDALDPTPFGDPPSPPPSLPSSVQASNLFEVGKLVKNKKKGIAFLFVNVPGPGEVGLEGKGVKNVGVAAASARKSLFTPGGVVKLRIKPGKGKKARKLVRQLKNKGKAKLKVRVTYVPTGGVANTKARKVKLVRR